MYGGLSFLIIKECGFIKLEAYNRSRILANKEGSRLNLHLHTHTHTHIYIYIYIYRERERERKREKERKVHTTRKMTFREGFLLYLKV